MASIDLNLLASLPDVVAALQARVAELEARVARPEPEALLTAAQVATMLGMTASAVRAAARRSTIPSVKVDRRVRFERSTILHLVARA